MNGLKFAINRRSMSDCKTSSKTEEKMMKISINGTDYPVKGMSDWKEDFNEDFAPGDYVTSEIADYFRDVLPPRNYGGGYLQVGEPYSHVPDEQGRYRATYNTFIEITENVWKYVGHCFAGEKEHKENTNE